MDMESGDCVFGTGMADGQCACQHCSPTPSGACPKRSGPGAIAWSRRRLNSAAYKPRSKQQVGPLPAKADGSAARRFQQMRSGHTAIGRHKRIGAGTRRTREHPFKNHSRWELPKKPLGEEIRTGMGRRRKPIASRQISADELFLLFNHTRIPPY